MTIAKVNKKCNWRSWAHCSICWFCLFLRLLCHQSCRVRAFCSFVLLFCRLTSPAVLKDFYANIYISARYGYFQSLSSLCTQWTAWQYNKLLSNKCFVPFYIFRRILLLAVLSVSEDHMKTCIMDDSSMLLSSEITPDTRLQLILPLDRREMCAMLKFMAKFLLMSRRPGFHSERFGISFTREVSTWTALITFLFCQCQSIHPLYVQTGEEPRWCRVTLPSRSISKGF